MRRVWQVLPGPLPVRVVEAAVLVAIALVALHFFYSWLGTTFLDPGGTVG
jgi:hypothetical protein